MSADELDALLLNTFSKLVCTAAATPVPWKRSVTRNARRFLAVIGCTEPSAIPATIPWSSDSGMLVRSVKYCSISPSGIDMHLPVSYTHLRAHETRHDLVCRLLLE